MFTLGVSVLNTVVTSRESILRTCRGIVAENGISALNMRLVAERCHIALGTLYNYDQDKDALILAVVESIWKEIFHPAPAGGSGTSFLDSVAE